MQALEMLHTLGLPDDLIEDVRGMLNEHAELLEGVKPEPIGDVFGGSPAGTDLSHHASLARQHVARAVLQMAAGLRGFGEELSTHQVRMDHTDIQSAADLKRIEAAAACIAPTDFDANAACALPTEPLDGGEGEG